MSGKPQFPDNDYLITSDVFVGHVDEMDIWLNRRRNDVLVSVVWGPHTDSALSFTLNGQQRVHDMPPIRYRIRVVRQWLAQPEVAMRIRLQHGFEVGT